MNLPNTYLTLNDLKCYFFMKYVINYFWIASFLFDSDDLYAIDIDTIGLCFIIPLECNLLGARRLTFLFIVRLYVIGEFPRLHDMTWCRVGILAFVTAPYAMLKLACPRIDGGLFISSYERLCHCATAGLGTPS